MSPAMCVAVISPLIRDATWLIDVKMRCSRK
jgi:hypothetical protein